MISAGGALGGLLVGLVAPHLFDALYELQIGLVLCALLTLVVLGGDTEYAWFRGLLPPAAHHWPRWPRWRSSALWLTASAAA